MKFLIYKIVLVKIQWFVVVVFQGIALGSVEWHGFFLAILGLAMVTDDNVGKQLFK